jgi:predicted GIY-YIG superfamily endonuclease
MSASQAERRGFDPRLPLHTADPVNVYVLHSVALDRFYVGIAEHPQRRLAQHRRGQSAWSARADDWTIVHVQTASDFRDARRIEKQIKARGAARYLADRIASQSRADAGQG